MDAEGVRPPRTGFWTRFGCAAAFVVCLSGCFGAGYAVRLFFAPYQEVSTTVTGIPQGTTFLCLVADGPEPMRWSMFKVFPFSMHPDSSTASFLRADAPPVHSARVLWIQAKRVGVLRRTKERQWFVHWFDGPKAVLAGRSFVWGGGTWEADLREADEVRPVTEGELRAMGIQRSLEDEQ